MVSPESGLGPLLESFRNARRELEASVLPLATSVDGRRFSVQASLHGLPLQIGGYVVLEGGGLPRLGQVLTLERRPAEQRTDAARPRRAAPRRTGRRSRSGSRAAKARSWTATPRPSMTRWFAPPPGRKCRPGSRAARGATRDCRWASWRWPPTCPASRTPGGFNRHTFLCGQSGSGKTYSLGVILERLLTETDLRLVILDPNSDFVRLGQVRGGVDPALAQRYQDAARGIAVYSADAAGERRLRLHAADIDPATQAAALRLDPIEDREEYAALAEFLASGGQLRLETLAGSDRPEAERRLGLRLRNLGVDRFGVWAREEPGSVLDAVHDQDVRCVVVDLGSLPTREEQSLVAATVLGDLWRRRQERRPVLVVIDEAHNVCPAEPPDQLVAVAAEHAIRIAAEGRKFGLYLLVSTQRPQKIAGNVLSQADNLVLMRLNSLADAAFTAAAFSFVPPSLIERWVIFRQGEALIAGRISPQPALLRFGARISEEGGADVPATWAAAR